MSAKGCQSRCGCWFIARTPPCLIAGAAHRGSDPDGLRATMWQEVGPSSAPDRCLRVGGGYQYSRPMAGSGGASSRGAGVPREDAGDPYAPTVRSCLQIPPLADATVVAGGAGLDARRVRWMTVIEGPVEDFVSPGDFVLTTGLGYDEARLRVLVGDVGAAGAAALA